MEESWRKLIDSSKSILILLPTRSFFDQVAAGLSLYLSLRNKRDVEIYSPEEMTVEFNRLIGINKVTNELGNKNLVINFSDYDATGIERVSWDIDGDEFKLTVIPKPGITSPKKEQVKLSYSGVSADTVILVGGANENHFPALSSKDLVGAKIAHVGVRDLNLKNENFMSFSSDAVSVCEIAESLIEKGGLLIDEDVATNLLFGLEDKTENFSSRDVTADTFEIAAKLLRAGGRRNPPKEERNNYPQGALPDSGMIKVDKNKNKPSQNTPKDWFKPKIYKSSNTKDG
jgi:nanoRNase/pAp phosphatase (c-di-AMP/oligoRNAs hydrolase)